LFSDARLRPSPCFPYFGNGAQCWLDLQGQYDIAVVEREKGGEIAKRVRPADAA
jgi:plasmid maintenance system antidote protein VapI